jgi:hypothetical protein
MIIKACLECNCHKVKQAEEGQSSYCGKERCWAVFTNCITQKAVERFLSEECGMTDGFPNTLYSNSMRCNT